MKQTLITRELPAVPPCQAHPFFGDGDDAFDTVAARSPPYVPPAMPEPKFVDGATQDWDLEGDFTVMPLRSRERSVRDIIVQAERDTHPHASHGGAGSAGAGAGSGAGASGHRSPPKALHGGAYWCVQAFAGF